MRKWVALVLIGLFCCLSVAAAKENPQARLVADDYGIEAADIQNLMDENWSWADINHAAFLSVAVDCSLAEVVKAKGISGDWSATEKLLGATEWHIKAGQNQLIAQQLYQVLGTNSAEVLKLLTQKYHPKAIAMAAAFASQSSASMDYILAQKLDNRSWYETAQKNGISPAQTDELIQQLNDAFRKRVALGDTYGAYGTTYGYRDVDYYDGGYHIEILNLGRA